MEVAMSHLISDMLRESCSYPRCLFSLFDGIDLNTLFQRDRSKWRISKKKKKNSQKHDFKYLIFFFSFISFFFLLMTYNSMNDFNFIDIGCPKLSRLSWYPTQFYIKQILNDILKSLQAVAQRKVFSEFARVAEIFWE